MAFDAHGPSLAAAAAGSARTGRQQLQAARQCTLPAPAAAEALRPSGRQAPGGACGSGSWGRRLSGGGRLLHARLHHRRSAWLVSACFALHCSLGPCNAPPPPVTARLLATHPPLLLPQPACPHWVQTTSGAPASPCWMSRSVTTQVSLLSGPPCCLPSGACTDRGCTDCPGRCQPASPPQPTSHPTAEGTPCSQPDPLLACWQA